MLIKRLDAAMEGFYKQGRGFPKFKNRSNFRSFQYKPNDVFLKSFLPRGNPAIGTFRKIKGSKVYLPSVGWMRFHNSRSIPEGFSIRTVTIWAKADGWYMSVRIEDKSVPDFLTPDDIDIKTVVGLDMGIGKLVYCSDGSVINNPKFATCKSAKRTLKIRQRRVSRKKKGSLNKRKHQQILSRLQQKIASRRESYQWQAANKIVGKADGIARRPEYSGHEGSLQA